ncbi:MAG: GNAT family N-acetyltransferase [Desulfuromonadaceae bacterium]|nr:GNAT family N-acetyltransferase [Desulfuromonadaceae bacterium]
MNLISTLKGWLYPTYRKYFSRAYLYEGALKSGNGSAKCLFVDNDKFYLQVLHALFIESPTLVRTFRCWIPGLKRLLNSPRLDADICFANVPLRHARLFHDSATYIMQTRVNQKLDIETALESNSRYIVQRKEVSRKKIKKFGLTQRISHNSEDLAFFYHRMSQPLIRKFGDAVMRDSYDELKSVFEKGVLIFVLYNGEPISGVLCYEDKGLFTAYRSGLLDGDPSYLKMGATSAFYFYFLEYAREHGCQTVDLMQSLPFLNDGVYRHKQHWGAKTGAFEGATSWVYLFNRSSSETFARFIENIPLIVHTKNGLEGVISLADDIELTTELEQKLSSQYGDPGIYGLQIVRSNGIVEQIIL